MPIEKIAVQTKKQEKAPQKEDKAKKVQGQIDEVINIMEDNIAKTVQRGEKLDKLKDKSSDLEVGAKKFKKNAKAIKSMVWWQACKSFMTIMILLAVIGGFLIWKYQKELGL